MRRLVLISSVQVLLTLLYFDNVTPELVYSFMPVTWPLSRHYLSPEAKAEKSKNIPPGIQEVVTGMMLGDGYIRMHGNDAHMKIHQKDKAFVEHLWNMFISIALVGAAAKLCSHLDKRNGKTTYSYQFATFTLPYFTGLFNQWYKLVNGKKLKVIPANIAELLTPRAFAYWIAGDGTFSKRHSVIQIATNSFSPEEIDLLRAVLLECYDIDSSRVLSGNKGRDQYIIRIPRRELAKVQDLIQCHMPPMMLYRIGL